MRFVRLRHILLKTILLSVMGLGAAAQTPTYDTVLGVATFDAAWQIVYDTHFDTTFNGIDWLALRDELRPKVEAAESRSELRRILSDMVGRLGQSHFALIPEELADADLNDDPADGADSQGDLGFDVRLIDDEIVVTQVEADGPAHAAGIAPGWVLETIGDTSTTEIIADLRSRPSRNSLAMRGWLVVKRRLAGEAGSEITLGLRDGNDELVERTMSRRPDPSRRVKFGNLPPFLSRFAHRTVRDPGGRTVGVMWFNFWMIPLMLDLNRAIDELRELDGIVVDLRGNLGGAGAMVMGASGHFFSERASLGEFVTRSNTLQIVANPRLTSSSGQRVEPFGGPVAVLTDEGSASASEVFAGGMQSLGRVRVFGDTTAGAVLPASFDRLPNGDVLYHAFAEFITSTGVRLEGRGVYPDEYARATRQDYLEGRDVVLEAALRWIATENASAGSSGAH